MTDEVPCKIAREVAESQSKGLMWSEEVWDLIQQAYIFTFPLAIMDATMTMSTNVKVPESGRAPVNQLSHATQLANAAFHQVVTPNVDTLYTQMFFDLSEDAVVFHKPASDRFLLFQIMDAWSDTVAVLGTGADTQGERTYLLTGPEFSGSVPEGMTEVKMPTAIGWLLGRTVCFGKDDLEEVYALQSQMDARALSLWLSDRSQPDGTFDEQKNGVPIRMALAMGPQKYFNRVNELMVHNSPYKEDASLLKMCASIGIGPGLRFDASILGENAIEKWKSMLSGLMNKLIGATAHFMVRNGAFKFFGAPISRFGQEYNYRALVAIAGFGANPVEVAVYMKCDMDDEGQVLNAKNNYVLHFEPDALPPVKENGFWSVTAYGDDDFLIENTIERYAISDRTDFKLNEDGSLDLYLQETVPAGCEENWLPVGNSGFHLFLRIYLPEESVLHGEWSAPSLKKYQ